MEKFARPDALFFYLYHRSLDQFSDKINFRTALRTYRAKTDQTAHFDHITITDKVLHAAATRVGAGVLYQISTLLWNTLVKAFSSGLSQPATDRAPLRESYLCACAEVIVSVTMHRVIWGSPLPSLCCVVDLEPCLLSCPGSSVGRTLCLGSRVSWVRVPPGAAHF